MSLKSISISLFLASALLIPGAGVVALDAPLQWMASSILLVGAMLACATGNLGRRRILVFSAVFHLTNAAWFVSYLLQGEGFNQRFFYHVRPDIVSAGILEFVWLFSGGILLLISMLVSLHLVYRVAAIKVAAIKSATVFHARLSLLAMIAGLFLYNPLGDAGIYLYQKISVSKVSARTAKMVDELRYTPRLMAADATNTEKKNIVLLYLESVEASYFDAQYYPDLLPELSQIREQSVWFNSVHQVDAASWTIAGVVASQCGVPLHSPFSKSMNTMNVTDTFMKNAVCLSDLLSEQGYKANYMGGANTAFAGKQAFLKTHNYSAIFGLKQLKPRMRNKDYTHSWGLYDDTFYRYALARFKKLSARGDPFLFSMLTLDTHHPKGHVSASCQPYPHNPTNDSMLHALHCADQLAAKFIRDVRSSRFSDNTIIVVMSDHLAMRNSLWQRIKAYPKPRMLTFFINYPQDQTAVISHPGTHYDIAPTILQAIGMPSEDLRFPWGKSLLDGSGFMHANKMDINLGSKPAARREVANLWRRSVGNAKAGIEILSHGNEVKFGEQRLSLKSDGWTGLASSLIKIDPVSGDIEDISIWAYSDNMELGALAKGILKSPENIFLAIGPKKHLKGLVEIDAANMAFDQNQRAYFLGSVSSQNNISGEINGKLKQKSIKIPSRKIDRLLSSRGHTNDALLAHYRSLILKTSDIERETKELYFFSNIPQTGNMAIKVCRQNQCESFIQINDAHFILQRGLSIIGVTASGKAVQHAHIDGCTETGFQEPGELKKIIQRQPDNILWVFAIHDTVGCANELPRLQHWNTIDELKWIHKAGFREPYIGFYQPGSAEALEYLGQGRHSLSFKLDGETITVK